MLKNAWMVSRGLVVAIVVIGLCGCPHIVHTALCIGVEHAVRPRYRRPPPPRIALDEPPADGVRIEGNGFSLVMPVGWRLDAAGAPLDPSGRHQLAIEAYDWTKDAASWVRAYHPNTRQWSSNVEDRPAIFVQPTARAITLVVADDRELYEVTCAQADGSDDVPNAVCRRVLGSFRLTDAGP